MTKRSFSIFALAGAACVMGSVALSSAAPSVSTAPTIAIDPCLTQSAAKTVNLEAGAAAVTLSQPNVTPSLDPSKPPPASACNGWIGDIVVASTSKPPAGYGDGFTLAASWDAGWTVTKKTCTEAKNEVKIYRKSSKTGFAWAGGGMLVGTWTPTTGTNGTCAFAPASDFKNVSGKVPGAGETDTYRAIFAGGFGSGSVKVTRSK